MKGKRSKPAKAARKRGQEAAWWDEAVEVPRAGLDDAAKLQKRAKRLRRFIWASVILAPFSLGTMFLVLAGSLDGPVDGTVEVYDEYADSRPIATVAVADWLAQDPTPLPGGTIVGWHSATRDVDEPPAATDGQEAEPTYTVESHRFTVADVNGTMYDVHVALGYVDDEEPAVIGEPSLIPRVPGDGTYDGPVWVGLDPDQDTTDSMYTAISAWGAAYSSGDPAQLRLAVADQDPNRNYLPLNGATISDPTIVDVAGIWDEDVPMEQRTDLAPVVVARVQFVITWPGTPQPDDPSAVAYVTYDLLLHNAETAAPSVVAWGGPGTGAHLEAYENAVPVEIDPIAPPETDDTEPVAPPETEPPTDEADPGKKKKNKGKKKRKGNGS